MADMSRTDSSQAMNSIFSAYADNENMDEDDDDDDHQNDTNEVPDFEAQTTGSGAYNISESDDDEPKQPSSQPPLKTEKRPFDEKPIESEESTKRLRNAPTKLVSYGDMDDEGGEGKDDFETDEPPDELGLVNYDDTFNQSTLSDELTKVSQSNLGTQIELPPEPTTKCSNKLQDKIINLYKKRQRGMDLNASIQNRKDFSNPSIYEKLISYCNIDEKGTNYPPELFNPLFWGKESFYDELARSQKLEMEKREKEKRERTKVEFVTGTKKQAAELAAGAEQKRKSKWDTQPPSTAVSKPIVITTTVINPPIVSITTSSSGVKTVISATGALKKPK